MMSLEAHKLYQPEFWSDPFRVHALFDVLRDRDPIHFCSHAGYPDFWHVTRFRDLLQIEKAPRQFLSAPRMTINTLAREQAVSALTGGSPYIIRPLNAMDFPDHQPMRDVLQDSFSPSKIKSLRPLIETTANQYVAKMVAMEGAFDFAKEIAWHYPLRVIMPLLGVPPADYSLVFRLTKQLFGPADPDSRRRNVDLNQDPAADMKEIYSEFADYFFRAIASRRQIPSNDLISKIANAKIGGSFLRSEDAISYCILIATAGHDTTAYSLSELMYQIVCNPELFRAFSKDPLAIAPKIVEEAFRLASPTRHFIRTAASDCRIGDVLIKSGESIILWFPSACRDQDVFNDPHRLRLDRAVELPHSAFGHGPHRCLGRGLAQAELIAFLLALSRIDCSFLLLGDPAYTHSNFVGGMKSLLLERHR